MFLVKFRSRAKAWSAISGPWMIFALVRVMSLSRRSGNLEEALDPGGVALDPAQLAVGRQEVLDAAVARDQAVADVRVETLFQGDQVEVVVLVL